MSAVVIDTNLLLDDPKIIYKLSNKYDQIILPLTVLKELDKHKSNPDLAYSARNAIYTILDFKKEFPDKLILSINDDELSNNDELIIDAAAKNDAVIATKDISMSVIAEAKGIKTKLYNVVTNGLSDPYV